MGKQQYEHLRRSWRILIVASFVLAQVFSGMATAQEAGEENASAVAPARVLPEALEGWRDWATWNDQGLNSPPVYSDPTSRVSFWPSRLKFEAEAKQAKWEVAVEVFSKSWVPLPGDKKFWPQQVRLDGDPVVVVERNGGPAVQLMPGQHNLVGEMKWDTMPQRIAIPREIGLLELSVNGEVLERPAWDANGSVWLRRVRTESAEKNLLSAQVYRVVVDGIPLWLETEIELIVSGKSREEEIGSALPAGWKLATIDSPLPVAIDESGKLKAQVRSGKWSIKLTAFANEDLRTIRFADGTTPIVDSELVAFQAAPSFRLAELTELSTIDVSQTTFPERWKQLPVFKWETDKAFQLDEKVRGMGLQHPQGLTIRRHIWLDEDGAGGTYHDSVKGQLQQLWRLDAADEQKLGSVRSDGQAQLITANPKTGAEGVEIRSRNLNVDAIGEMASTQQIPATGWQVDADSLEVTLSLPPGWRMLALFGADSVRGDWLTAWSLLDLFLLLIFTVAVFRIWGLPAGVVAFIAFGLAYHEPGAPRLTWLFLLIPVALLRVVPDGGMQRLLTIWKYVAVGLLLVNLAPFLAYQTQTVLYPQLERRGITYQPRRMFGLLGSAYQTSSRVADAAYEEAFSTAEGAAASKIAGRLMAARASNLSYDAKARIQTGPAQPDWTWNQVYCSWTGPVAATQNVRPWLISCNQHRLLTLVRVVLLSLLAVILLAAKRLPRVFSAKAVVTAAGLLLLVISPGSTEAQEIPDAETIEMLRQRLLETSDAFPNAAEIPNVTLSISANRATMTAEVHAATQVAVPLPGKLPTWSPVSVRVDDEQSNRVRRKDDFLWVVLNPGVHRIVVESVLPNTPEWEWTFLLAPRNISVTAAEWDVSGINANGTPEQQVFFSRKQQATEADSAYDRKDFNAIVAVNRHIETGLIWQVRTEVTRLSKPGKAVSLSIPLLPGESVLTPGVVASDGRIEVRLGAGQKSFRWESDLPTGTNLSLEAAETDEWVERWHLVTSPVWHMNYDGIAPVFAEQNDQLIPVWHPWPGEQVSLSFTKPQAVTGETITVQRVRHETTLGQRHRTGQLNLDLESSLGGDFRVQLPDQAQVSAIRIQGQPIPVRLEADQLVLPVQPGKQSVEVDWRTNESLQTQVNSPNIMLPVKAANVTSTVTVPRNRWVLWTTGPTRGPAVQFWSILIFAIGAAMVLGGLKLSPLGRIEWALLAVGLTQVHIAAALFVVAWLFALALRGRADAEAGRWWTFNLRQLGLVLMTFVALGILVVVVGEGLLGYPEMFIVGNGSSRTYLKWFEPKIAGSLPITQVFSVSVWFYRLLMLFWALWLAVALLRWLTIGWKHFTHGTMWRHRTVVTPNATAPTQV